MPMTKNPARMYAALITCRNIQIAYDCVMTAQKSASSARPFLITYPTGCCIHEFATRIQYAEKLEAAKTNQMQVAWTFGESFFQPNIHRPMNVDSRKKATVASIARREPKMSPTYLEYRDQLVPNWNSSVIPVTTPRAKLMMNNLPQYLVILLYSSSPVLTYWVSIIATRRERPNVSGTKRK